MARKVLIAALFCSYAGIGLAQMTGDRLSSICSTVNALTVDVVGSEVRPLSDFDTRVLRESVPLCEGRKMHRATARQCGMR